MLPAKPISVSEISEHGLKYTLNLSLRIITRIGLDLNPGHSICYTCAIS